MTDLDRALDRYTITPLGDDFADRVLAKALAAPAVAPARPMRDRRGVWKRGRTILFGVGAFSLMSAAAATTGVFGDVAKDVPVIGTLIASVAPAKPKPVPVPKPKPVAVAKVDPKPAAPVIDPVLATPPVAETIIPPVTIARAEERRAMRRARVEAMIAVRQERRAQRGLPPLSDAQLREIKKIAMIPPKQRAEVKARVTARIEAAGGRDALTRPERRAIIREEIRASHREWRARKMARAAGQSLTPEESQDTSTNQYGSSSPSEAPYSGSTEAPLP